MKPNEEATGVYFLPADYLGFWKRLLIDTVDLFVIVLLWLIVMVGIAVGSADGQLRDRESGWLLLLGIGFVYLVVVKWLGWRTLGYLLCGARIVEFTGQPPGLFSLTLRFLFFAIGPINYLVDLIWVGGDRQGQALRDKLAHTYVVRAQAAPAGQGRFRYVTCDLMGCNVILKEVSSGPI